jgi:hypothetical protein
VTLVTGELRDACIVLAGQALQAAGGDEDTAKAALPDALEAIGALPYQSAAKYHWGAAS